MMRTVCRVTLGPRAGKRAGLIWAGSATNLRGGVGWITVGSLPAGCQTTGC